MAPVSPNLTRHKRSLCFAAGPLIAGLPVDAQLRTLNPHQTLARAIYKELVEINTVDSVGSVTKTSRNAA